MCVLARREGAPRGAALAGERWAAGAAGPPALASPSLPAGRGAAYGPALFGPREVREVLLSGRPPGLEVLFNSSSQIGFPRRCSALQKGTFAGRQVCGPAARLRGSLWKS